MLYDAILTSAQKLTQVSLIYRTEPETKKWKQETKKKKTDMLRSIGKQSGESVESVLKVSSTQKKHNKAVINRRLRSRCCQLGSYFKRSKSSPVRPLACNWYYCVQFIAMPKAGCLCAALQLGGDVEQPWLMRRYDVIHKPEVHNVSLRHQRRTEPRP